MMNRAAFIIAALFVSLGVSAQNFTRFNLGEVELTHYNPAAAVLDGSRAFAATRYCFIDNPTYYENPLDISAGFNIQGNWGGIVSELSSDSYSYFDRLSWSIHYNRGWRIGKRLFSASAGINLCFDKVLWDQLQGFPGTGTTSYCSPDLCLGFEYSDDHIRAGIGMMNLIETKVIVDDTRITRNPRCIVAYFSYRFDFKGFGVTPDAMIGYCERSTVDLGVRLDWKKTVWASYYIRAIDISQIANVGVNIPHTPICLTFSYAKAMFQNIHYACGGIIFRLQ